MLMIDIQNINEYGLDSGFLTLLKEIAQKYCPEELQAERKALFPDEVLNLEALTFPNDTVQPQRAEQSALPKDDGFGI